MSTRALLSTPLRQILLADLWLGGLRTRKKNTNIKVMLSLLFPPLILVLGFRSREELKTMPQTREEHLYDDQGRSSDSESDTDSDDDNMDMRNEHDPEAQLVNSVSHLSHPVTPTLQTEAPLCNSNNAVPHSSTITAPSRPTEPAEIRSTNPTVVIQNGTSVTPYPVNDSVVS
ncbi:transient receptor potential cation channel trpm-like [Macrobrachium nipponense]|uniref:transient receptor potential cation channel trpm-like n=1 Tax=Macrobrachium nipponense TaxID=159736 RepID=UPI0030C86AE7